MNLLDVEQHSSAWFKARLGMITASKVSAVVKKRTRGEGELKPRRDLKLELLSEILTGQTVEHYVSPSMQWGIDNEGQAKAEYEIRAGVSLEPIGLVMHPTIARAAASPDGMIIGGDGFVEVKCPNTTTHLDYLIADVVPKDYWDQMDWQMACAGPEIQWVDFVSFDPRLAPEFQLFIVRRKRDDARIAEMEAEVEQFITEVNTMALRLQNYGSSMTKVLEKSIRHARVKRKPHLVDEELMAALQEEIVP